MPVALQDLRRGRRRLETEAFAGEPFELGIGGRIGADRARELADAQLLQRTCETTAAAVERDQPE